MRLVDWTLVLLAQNLQNSEIGLQTSPGCIGAQLLHQKLMSNESEAFVTDILHPLPVFRGKVVYFLVFHDKCAWDCMISSNLSSWEELLFLANEATRWFIWTYRENIWEHTDNPQEESHLWMKGYLFWICILPCSNFVYISLRALLVFLLCDAELFNLVWILVLFEEPIPGILISNTSVILWKSLL